MEVIQTGKSIEKSSISISSQESQGSTVEDVDIQKYLKNPNDLQFSYESVHKEIYKGAFSKKQLEEKLDQFKVALGEKSYNHQTQKMSGRAALLLIMKRTGDEDRNILQVKQLLDFIVSKPKQQNIDELKSQLIEDIENRFAKFKI
ncbi:hypothetical protein TTHERM_00242240 (macronuclear) [Tetrahymena thermophila SB210]|uniref:Uncharacterized protein n=1 Tax=Tetrahymena thermophila (strain SB210) TaxID=312017 RepID=I7LXI4_TETTS|nr:hypothetical protein TTHERM_00242240 [Tetrahymena thermophila SB210]EAS04702.1 hypothetical protein TTHERM_00242240 [Tetrahymena thermophila SB210]|eukprot:XP_001024947.1 hypothetical protein TTHERM_00242240 [Tetrahymena thermophila SB210]